MYGTLPYHEWLILMVNVGKYAVRPSSFIEEFESGIRSSVDGKKTVKM